jgi:hypothetical protein
MGWGGGIASSYATSKQGYFQGDKKPRTGEVRIPDKRCNVNYINLLFRCVYVIDISLYNLHKKK